MVFNILVIEDSIFSNLNKYDLFIFLKDFLNCSSIFFKELSEMLGDSFCGQTNLFTSVPMEVKETHVLNTNLKLENP